MSTFAVAMLSERKKQIYLPRITRAGKLAFEGGTAKGERRRALEFGGKDN